MASLWETSAGVNSLSLEDPWLAAALADGTVALLNIEAAMRQPPQGGRPTAQSPLPKRLFQQPSGAACCADLADQWLAAGSGDYDCHYDDKMMTNKYIMLTQYD